MHSIPPATSRAPADGSFWQTVVKHDFAASFVVFLVALPLCMGIAQASGAPVASGVITGIVGGLVVALIAGSPLQVRGPAAGLSVLVYAFIRDYGLPAMGVVVLLAGVIQLAAGLLRIGQWFRAVSPAVIRGMLSGIGVLIFACQFHLMVDDSPKEGGVANLVTIPQSIAKGIGIPEMSSSTLRDERTGFLRQFGNLHEKQEEIRELVNERVSDRPTAELIELEKSLLTPLVERQAAQTAALQAIADDARSSPLATDGTKSSARFVTALDKALAASTAAVVALEQQDLATVRERQEAASISLTELSSSLKNHNWAALMGVLTIAVIVLWQTVTPKRWRLLPGPLIAVVVTTGVAFSLSLPVLYVEVPDSLLDGVHFPSLIALQDVPMQVLLTSALVFAAVASAETLLCATAVDQMHNGSRTRYDRELSAQGIGNMLCGLLGGIPMTGVIVRSATNVQAGARTRASAFLHGVWLLLFVAVLGGMLRYVPTSVLAGILVYTGYKLFDVKAIKELRAYGWSEVAIFLATVVGIVVFDLLTGVLIGIGLSGLKLLVNFSRLKARLVQTGPNESRLELNGAATFIRLPKLAATLERIPAGTRLHVDLSGLSYLDHACVELLGSWVKQHEANGGEANFDWNAAHDDVRRSILPSNHFRNTFPSLNGSPHSNGAAIQPIATPERIAV